MQVEAAPVLPPLVDGAVHPVDHAAPSPSCSALVTPASDRDGPGWQRLPQLVGLHQLHGERRRDVPSARPVTTQLRYDQLQADREGKGLYMEYRITDLPVFLITGYDR